MGFLDHLFKNKPGEEKMGEEEKGATEAVAGNGKNADTAPDPGEFLRPKRFYPRGGIVYPPVRPSPPHESGPAKKPPASEGRPEIVITLGDVLSRLPTQLLHAGFHDEKRELRFFADDLSADISRGRAAVPLSRIAALCPDVFVREIGPADDLEIRLPLQKLVEQIGRLRGRRMTPPAGPKTPPVPGAPATAEAVSGRNVKVEESSESAFGEEEIQLSLAAILPGCPPEIFVGKLPPIDAGLRITLPYAPIERQFATERVEVSARHFVSVLPSELRPHFDARDGIRVPLPIEEILKNLPGPPEPAARAGGAPEDAATLEAADEQVALAEFLAQSDDQSLAPTPIGEPASEAVGEPPDDPPGPAEVAAQTPRETAEQPSFENAPVAPESAAPADPVIPGFHVFAPPPPLVIVAPVAPTEKAIAPPDLSAAGTKDRAAAEDAAPPSGDGATVHIQPPPIARPVFVHPPPILGACASAEQAHPMQPVVSSDPEPEAKDPLPPEVSAEMPAPFPQDGLQTLFMTDEALDLATVSRHVVALPGVRACVLDRRGEKASAGEVPEGFTFPALHAAAARLSGAASDAGPLPFGALQSFTLHGDQAAISFFARPGLLLAVLHRALPPGVRERLVTVAAELT